MATHVTAPSRYFGEDGRTPRFRQRDFLPRVKQRTAPREAQSEVPLPAPENGQEKLLVKLLPLVRHVALQMREHLPTHVDLDDLIGAGVLGLLDAVRKFDASKHVKIETYARHRIRGAILDGLRGLDTASRDMRKKNKKAEKVYRELQAKLGRPVDDEEMAQALGVSLKKWYRAIQELHPLGVDWLRPRQSVEGKQRDEETLVADDHENPFDLCYRREQRDILNRALVRLTERERLIILLYYNQELTMKKIGAKLGIDESRVSQIHSAALRRLQSHVKAILRRPQQPSGCPAYVVAGGDARVESCAPHISR